MSPETEPRVRRLPRVLRIVRGRPRLFVSALIGLIVIAALPIEWRLATRLLVGWDVGITLYLMAAYHIAALSDIARIRKQAALQDEGRIIMLMLTVAAALASLAAIVVELGSGSAAGGRQPTQLALATITIVLSWAFIHTIFALHYAHEFYANDDRRGGGLNFPGEEDPDYWDFVYFSFVIGMTSQVSDVTVGSKAIRQTVAAHGIISFIFNAALLALTVNIAASAI